jgi:hypothetical protein
MNARSMIRFCAGLIGMTCTALLLVADSAECSGNGYDMHFAGTGNCGGAISLRLYQLGGTCGMTVESSDTSVLPSGSGTYNGDPRYGGWSYEGELFPAGDDQRPALAIRRCEVTRHDNTLFLDCFDRPSGCLTADGGVVIPRIGDGGIDECTETPACGMTISGR